jgi:hypothetical protein
MFNLIPFTVCFCQKEIKVNTYFRNRILLIAIPLLTIFYGCNRVAPEAPKRTTLDSTLQVSESELAVPVFYPLADLENLVNEKLANRIIDAKMAINEKNDSLFLLGLKMLKCMARPITG